ncbi:MAG: toxin-antitoxin system YwqK family antitoxin [Haliscomenobacter sp.]|nr:toxin-antitoxin system YwqK family antitoxin [Haliscomenobacter sp.]MBK9491847.1 toxin-antitoxin system YwqK family antitoxin [Haliscomenobacter sp.]
MMIQTSYDSIEAPQTSAALETVEETDPEGNQLQYTRRDSDGLREGVFTKMNAKGAKIEEASYKNGKLDGMRILYYPKGDTMILESYQNDLFEGIYKSFYPGGKIKMQGEYRNNTMEGTWIQYHENGQLKEEVLFSNNAENGPFKEYHPNGQLSVVGTYKDGANEEGTLKFYDEKGVHYKTMECKTGSAAPPGHRKSQRGVRKKVKDLSA